MSVRQRRGKEKKDKATPSTNGDDDNGKKKKLAKTSLQSKYVRKKASGKQALLFLFGVLSITGAILYHFYSLYGPAILLGNGWKDYDIEPYQWRRYLDGHDKTILLIGGPHRSGTTVVWNAIASHPDAVGFGSTFETGADYSEGILFQNVYPRFGVGMEFSANFGSLAKKAKGEEDVDPQQGGLGQWALLPESYVHMTKENHKGKLDDAKTLSNLMNRFAPFWDSNKKYGGEGGLKKAKVWIEKSPQNIVLSSFLEGIYNMPIEEDGTVGNSKMNKKKKRVTKFIFMTRHPIANVLATDRFIQESMGGFRDFEVMLRNYIQMHKYALEDSKKIQSPVMWVKLEDFTSNPQKTLEKIFSFLELSNDKNTISQVLDITGKIKSNPNDKYFAKWCTKDIEIHNDVIKKYSDEITSLGLGYDLTNICL